ncbi:hypothetical protein ACVBEF_15490 [Glaciimonas sp. GG7]
MEAHNTPSDGYLIRTPYISLLAREVNSLPEKEAIVLIDKSFHKNLSYASMDEALKRMNMLLRPTPYTVSLDPLDETPFITICTLPPSNLMERSELIKQSDLPSNGTALYPSTDGSVSEAMTEIQTPAQASSNSLQVRYLYSLRKEMTAD